MQFRGTARNNGDRQGGRERKKWDSILPAGLDDNDCVCVYIYIHTHTECMMGKPSSKLHKNENTTDITLYQIYLIKLHENILKYYRFNLFKQIAIGFNHGLQTT